MSKHRPSVPSTSLSSESEAAFDAAAYPTVANPVVDTVAEARAVAFDKAIDAEDGQADGSVISIPPWTQAERDRYVLRAALSRVCGLLGYSDEHTPPYSGDIDTADVSPEIAGLVEFARTARLK